MKFKYWFFNLIQKFQYRLLKSSNDAELKARIDCVRDFINDTLPVLKPEWSDLTILEGQITANYFFLSDESLPVYNFIIPQIPLYICVWDISSASWEEARSRGVTRLQWEKMQGDILLTENETLAMPTIGQSVPVQFIGIKWTDSVNHLVLLDRIKL